MNRLTEKQKHKAANVLCGLKYGDRMDNWFGTDEYDTAFNEVEKFERVAIAILTAQEEQ